MPTQAAIGALVFGVLAAASASGWSASARACSGIPPTCQAPVRLFPFNEVPGDHIYFKTLVDVPGELTLRDVEGRLIEADVRTRSRSGARSSVKASSRTRS